MTNAEEKKILKKIERLLRQADVSRGATEAEAKTALSKAEALMVQHKIERSRLKVDEDCGDDEIDEKLIMCQRKTSATKLICILIQDFFHVRVLYSKFSIHFVGTSDDIAFATYVYGYLRTTFDSLWLSYKEINVSAHKASYVLGLYEGFKTALKWAEASEIRSQSKEDKGRWQIIVRDGEKAMDDYINKKYSNVKKQDFDKQFQCEDSLLAGYCDGKNIRVNRALEDEQ
jgi:hypothetical protein